MGKAKTGSASVAAFLVPVLDTKKPPKQQCRIEGTILVPKNAAFTGYSKDYVKLLINRIDVNKQDIVIRGNYAALVGAVKFAQKKDGEHLLQSTHHRGLWLPNPGSNQGHSD